MKKKIHKQFFLLSFACVVLFSFGWMSGLVFADDYGLEETVSQTDLKSYPQDVPTIIGNVLGTVLSLVAVLFFGLMIYGGLLWMTAHGKEDQEKKALDTIIAGVIGVVIVLGSYAITKLIFGSLGEAAPEKKPGAIAPAYCLKQPDCDVCYVETDAQCASGDESFATMDDCNDAETAAITAGC